VLCQDVHPFGKDESWHIFHEFGVDGMVRGGRFLQAVMLPMDVKAGDGE